MTLAIALTRSSMPGASPRRDRHDPAVAAPRWPSPSRGRIRRRVRRPTPPSRASPAIAADSQRSAPGRSCSQRRSRAARRRRVQQRRGRRRSAAPIASSTTTTTSAAAPAFSARATPSRSTGSVVSRGRPPCPTSVIRMPSSITASVSRSRVVPGTAVTIARSAPASRLNSVDFPTFGRPTMATVTPSRSSRPAPRLGQQRLHASARHAHPRPHASLPAR